jgi:hypothetical protein
MLFLTQLQQAAQHCKERQLLLLLLLCLLLLCTHWVLSHSLEQERPAFRALLGFEPGQWRNSCEQVLHSVIYATAEGMFRTVCCCYCCLRAHERLQHRQYGT